MSREVFGFDPDWLQRQRELARKAEASTSSGNDGGIIDPDSVINISGQRPAPEGLEVSYDYRTTEYLEDGEESWQRDLGYNSRGYFLNATLGGEYVASLSADLIIDHSLADGTAEIDR